jgi:Transglycosylase SLT domain
VSGEQPRGPGEIDARSVLLAAHSVVRTAAGWKIALLAAAVLVPLLLLAGLFVASGSLALGGEGSLCTVRGRGGNDIPAEYVPWLQKAATKYKLGPRGFAIVAAIHEVESDFGRSPLPGVHSGTNSAGAAGPGQFLAGTWALYGVDANSDGWRDIYSVPDSVFATANYLRASGAPGNWRAAIFAYNHADWYVEEVLETAAGFGAGEVCQPAAAPLGELPSEPLTRIEYVARWIEARHVHYCWGGGHGPKPGPSPGSGEFCGPGVKGLDCSGAVRWLLVLSGYHDPGPLRSDALGAAYPSGPGRHVTIFSNVDHVFVTINGRDWGTSSANFAHGPAFNPQSHTGFAVSHLPGL